jgi:hypothetical protein
MVDILPNLSTISISWDTKQNLKELKLKLEQKLKKDITWDEFFNLINYKVTNNKRGKSGK